ncbi:MAG: type I methionyl aminopeptidase [Patescibacteria group bacterium]|nr:type I methionyl aminopeptidase [Patescibacteria group bacterium]
MKKQYRDMARTKEQLELMRESGRITALALKKVMETVSEGVTLADLDKIAEEEMEKYGAKASFKTVPGYHWATCMTLNDEVVHGIPRKIKVKNGDVLSIDLGALYQGWHTDAAWSVIVGGKGDKEKVRFLEIGEKALWRAIDEAVSGNRIGDISWALQSTIEDAGYSVVKSLAGHGVGRSAHEEPEIPEYGRPGTGVVLREDMTVAIEAIYNAGGGLVCPSDDGWTLLSCDGSLGGLFEMSVIISKKAPEVLTDWRRV